MQFLAIKKWCSANIFSDTKQKHVWWKICKVRKVFGCVAGAYYFLLENLKLKKNSHDVNWNVWTNIKTLHTGNNIFEKRIPTIRF